MNKKEKRRQKKKIARQKIAKERVLARRKLLREGVELEKEAERLQREAQPKLRPFRKKA